MKYSLLLHLVWGGVVLCLSLGLLLSPSLANAQAPVTVTIDAPAEVAPGSDFTARVAIVSVTDFDACNYDVTYDTNILEIVGSEGGAAGVTAGLIGTTDIPVDLWGFVPSGTPGRIRVIQNVPGVAGVSGSGYLAEIHFHVIGAGGTSSAITLENGCLSDKDAQEIPATWIGGSVHVCEEDTTPAPSAPPQSPASGGAGIPLVWLAVVVGGAAIVAGSVVILRRAFRR